MAIDKAIDSAVLDANLTTVADAIRAKGGTTDALSFPTGFADAISAIQAGGGEESDIDALIDRSITEISSSIATIGDYAFAYCKDLETVNIPTATSIGTYAFFVCNNLTTARFPKVITIGDYAFRACNYLETLDFPMATSIGKEAFNACDRLKTVDFTNFPVVTNIGDYAFQYCEGLETVNIPTVTSIGQNVFKGCSFLTTANFPVATSVKNYAFRDCIRLTAIILRSGTMCTLSNINAFNNTPIASGTGYIYVPRALVDSYKVASNWKTYATQFRALEDYTVDGTITGELDESKI